VTTTPTTDIPQAEAAVVEGDVTGDDDELVAEDEVLLEEISIDGMCGVY
jgi:mycofactocin precursor